MGTLIGYRDTSGAGATNGGFIEVTTAAPLPVNISGAGSAGATGLLKAEDAPSASGDSGVFFLAVRRDVLTVQANTNGDYNEVAVDKYGANLVKPELLHKATYSASATITPAAAATDVLTIIGSASKTVSIQKIFISGTQTTGGLVLVKIIRRSTADTGGASTAPVAVKHESADSAATTVLANYSANPGALGTVVGTLRSQLVPIAGVTATTSNIIKFDFGDLGKPIILNGVAEQIAINLNGATVTGGSLNIDIEFTEE